MDNEMIVKRWDVLYAERQATVDAVWNDITDYVLPLRGDFYEDAASEAEVTWDRGEIFDSTAIVACKQLASAMQANVTSFSQKWFDLKFGDDELNSDGVAMEWLQAVGNAIYDALVESNFDVEIAESYLDLASMGTTILIEEEDQDAKQLLFTALPLRECVFEENAKKQGSGLYRRRYMTALQLEDMFDDKLPTKILDKLDTPEAGTEKFEVIFAIFIRKDRKDADTSKLLAPKVRPIGYKYILKSSAELLGEEGGYYEMPAYITRWAKTGGSKWGYSPAMECIADIRTLNLIKEATLEAAGKAIDPATISEDGTIIGDLDLQRGGHTIVTNLDGLKPFESASKFDVSNMQIEYLTQSIRDAFFQNQLELKESPAMTATEVNVRYELMQRLLGPVVARLKTDLLDPVIQRTFNIIYRQGDLPELPEGYNIRDLNIEYNGVLPRAQKADQANIITEFLMEVAQMAEIFPSALDLIDVDAAVRERAILKGVPMKILKSEEEVDQGRKQDAEKQAEMQQIEQAAMGGEAMQSLGDGMQSLSQGGGGQGQGGGQGLGGSVEVPDA